MRSLSGKPHQNSRLSLMFLELMIIIADESDLAGDAGAPPAERNTLIVETPHLHVVLVARPVWSFTHNLISHITPISSMRPIRPISPIAPSLYNPLEKLAQLENLAHPFIIHVNTAQPSIKNNTPF